MLRFDCVFLLGFLLSMRAASPAAEQTETPYPFTGMWELNVDKSTFSPGPAPRSTTVTIGSDGRVSFEGIDGNGKTIQRSHASSVGRKVAFDGAKDLVIETRITGNIVDDTVTLKGKPIQKIHAVFSQNGRSVTVDREGKDPQGRSIHNRELYERP